MHDSSGGTNESRVAEARELLEMLDGCELNDWETNFVKDISGRIEEYGDRTIISPRQLFKLRDIKDQHL